MTTSRRTVTPGRLPEEWRRNDLVVHAERPHAVGEAGAWRGAVVRVDGDEILVEGPRGREVVPARLLVAADDAR